MNRFVALYAELESSTGTRRKVEAMARYFREAPPSDAVWGLYFLTGRRQKRVLSVRALAGGLLQRTGLPPWMIEECYAAVGDLGEVLALLATERERDEETGEEAPFADASLASIAEALKELGRLAPEQQVGEALRLLHGRDARGRTVLVKMLTGELRVGASELLALRALSLASGVDKNELAARILGEWEPTEERYRSFLSLEKRERGGIQPYPFFLATPLDPARGPSELGEASAFFAEWKWDGIRCQLVKRGGEIALWSRGEELMTERFPDLVEAAATLPDGVVLDGEAMPLDGPLDRGGKPLPFALLQKRIGRKKLSKKILDEVPMYFVAYDLLEAEVDLRGVPFGERRARLEAIVLEATVARATVAQQHPRIVLSPHVAGGSWDALGAQREEARERGVEGLMLKRLAGTYGVGRVRGDLYKWKIAPFEVDAVMIYAHPGHGRRSSLYTDYTFGVWRGGALVPIARAYSGLTDEEIGVLDRWIRSHTTERFGPTRVVEAAQVFTLHFEGIAASSRHKTGVALRFPRIARWRTDKAPKDAGSLEELERLLSSFGLPGTVDGEG